MKKKYLILPFIFPILLLLLIKLLSINCSYSVNSGIPQKTFPPAGLRMIIQDSSGNYWAWSHREELYKITPGQPDSTGNIVHLFKDRNFFNLLSVTEGGWLFIDKNQIISLLAPNGIYHLHNNDSIELIYAIDNTGLSYPSFYEIDCYGNCFFASRRYLKSFNIWDGDTVRTFEIDSILCSSGRDELGFKENYIAIYYIDHVPGFAKK